MGADKGVILRFVTAVFFIVAVTCVFLGRKYCWTTGKGTSSKDWNCGGSISADRWDDSERWSSQFFVAISSILCAILLLVIGFFRFTNRSNIPKVGQMGILAFSAVVALICAALEIWLGTGEYASVLGIVVKHFVQSYLAAAAFYILALILCLVELFFTWKSG